MPNTVRTKIVVESADALIAWHRRSLDAELVDRHEHDGAVVHAELVTLGTTVTVKDADATDPPTEHLVLDVRFDEVGAVDDAWAGLLAAGADVVFDLDDQFYGLRGGRLRDPFGIQWILSGPLPAGA